MSTVVKNNIIGLVNVDWECDFHGMNIKMRQQLQ